MRREPLIRALLASENPSIRWKVRMGALGEDPTSPALRRLRASIRGSPVARALLSRRDRAGEIHVRRDPYDKWQGAHWVLASLAEIGYPPGDERLAPLRDQVFALWLRDSYFREFEADTRQQAYRGRGVPVMRGRHRRCASQQGNALLSARRLGLDSPDSERLVERLLHWQWPDGGWNCDKNPAADSSSFMETLLPMRALALYGEKSGNADAREAAARAVEVFLSRHLFRRRSNRSVIAKGFVELHHPLYWHYDILGGLEAMAELGRIRDPAARTRSICSSSASCREEAGPRPNATRGPRRGPSRTPTTSTGAARAARSRTSGSPRALSASCAKPGEASRRSRCFSPRSGAAQSDHGCRSSGPPRAISTRCAR